MKDITQESDISFLVDEFYNYSAKDELIGHFFANVDWEQHKPKMRMFWEFVLLDKPNPLTSIFETHAKLPIKAKDFERWLSHFNQTIDTHFKGEKADLAKQRALTIAYTFNSKMNPNEELNLDF